MITESEIKQIIQKETLDIGEVFEVIQAYIFDRKGYIIDISLLVKLLNTQQGFFHYSNYFFYLRDVAFDFYTVKFNLEEYLLFHPKT